MWSHWGDIYNRIEITDVMKWRRGFHKRRSSNLIVANWDKANKPSSIEANTFVITQLSVGLYSKPTPSGASGLIPSSIMSVNTVTCEDLRHPIHSKHLRGSHFKLVSLSPFVWQNKDNTATIILNCERERRQGQSTQLFIPQYSILWPGFDTPVQQQRCLHAGWKETYFCI